MPWSPVSSHPGPTRRLLFVGWDAADWKIATPLLDRGELPHLNALIGRGVMGKLSSLSPLHSPLLWTSIATGKRADHHGVLAGAAFDDTLGVLRPIERTALRTSTVWDILRHTGLQGHVIDWPVSHPARSAAGIDVSDRFATVTTALDQPWPVLPGSVSPARCASIVNEFRIHPGELPADALLPFIPRLGEIDQATDDRVAALAEGLARTATVHAAATWALEHEPWDFAAIHCGGIETLGHRFMAYRAPRLPQIPEFDHALYCDVVDGAYRFHDMLLGRLLQLAGDGTVMLVSDHGVCIDDFRPRTRVSNEQWHRGRGMFCLAGDGIRKDELIYQAGLLDIAPTILTLFGLPVGADMEGRPLRAAFETPLPESQVASWDGVIGASRPADDASAVPATGDDDPHADAFAELEALGYDVTLSPLQQLFQRALHGLEQFHLAMVHRSAGRPLAAIAILETLLGASERSDIVVRLYLGACYFQLQRYDRCREALSPISDEDEMAAEKELLLALVTIAEKRPVEAFARLEIAARTRQGEPQIFCAIGRAYGQLEEYEKAEAAFAAAIAIDEESMDAHFGLALTYTRQQRWEEAANEALIVIGLDYRQSGAHYILGNVLLHVNRPVRALQAFETAVNLRPDWTAARRALAEVRHLLAKADLAASSA